MKTKNTNKTKLSIVNCQLSIASLRIFLLALLFPFFCNAQVPDTEYQALVDFFNATNGTNWPVANKWDVNQNNLGATTWPGVTVTDGHVTGLNLSFSNISGSVPTSIGNLKYLKTLSINVNAYTCNLSATDLTVFAGLDALTSLTLRSCQLQGEIPASWGQLANLTTISMVGNNITGLSPGFCNLPNLTTLDLSSNSQFTGLPPEFGNLSNLQSANFANDKIASLPATIGNLTKLTTFTLNNNQISGAVIREFEDMTALTSLNMTSNMISDVQAVLPSTVTSFSIGSQILTRDVFTYTGSDVVIDSLPRIMYYYRSGNTTNFDARNNFYVNINNSNVITVTPGANGSLTIPASVFSTLKTSDVIYISQSNGTAGGSRLNFTTTEVNTPPIPENEYLALVALYNSMNGSNWPVANRWDVSVNNLNESAWAGVSITDGHISGLNLSFSNISGAVPDSIGYLKYLKTLSINTGGSACNLSATDLNVFAGLDALTSLTLRSCQLQGEIPASWGQLANLTTISMVSNNITGLSAGFCNLPNLTTLDLSSNSQFTGLPPEFGNLSNLQSANFANDKIASLPTTIGNLKKLTTFTLNSNQITGAVIKEFGDMTALTSLTMSSNMISDIQAVFASNVSFSIGSQTITRDVFTYTGSDVVIDSLPRIMYYYRSGNTTNFDARNNFYVYINGSNVITVTPGADGSLTIPASVFSTLKTSDVIYISQSNGTAGGSRLNFTTTEVSTPPIPENEYLALVALYNSMNGSNWPVANRWDVSVNNLNESAWAGVSITDGHISGLNLSFSNISGAVPDSIGYLKYLKTLSINPNGSYTCNLSATDLNVFAGLDALTSLTLRSCQLQGEIPASWGQLANLTTISMVSNNITGLSSGFCNLPNLTTLDLSSNSQFTGLPPEFGNLSNLLTANFANDKIASLPASIGNLKKLTTFTLNNNQITGAVIREFEDMTALTSLTMSSNMISDVQAVLPSTVTSFNIGSQILTRDVFTYTGSDVVIDSLPRIMYYYRSGNTTNFDARNNFNVYINGSSVITVTPGANGSLTIPASVFSTLKTSDVIYIYQSNGTASGSRLNFTTTALNIAQIPDEEYQALVDFFNAMNGTNWPATNKWDVSVNNLNEGTWSGVSITDGHISGLNITFNNVFGAIPASFGNLKYLKTFNMTGYTRDLSATDLNVFSTLDSLNSLTLTTCQLKGSIPASWANLKNLATLNLSHNSLSGTLPAQISELTNLKTLNLSYNNLENVDRSLANLALTSVDFSYQTLNFPTVEITGNQLSVQLPLYCIYAINAGVGSFGTKYSFNLYINNVNVTNNFPADDGMLTFKNLDQYGISLTSQIRILQTAGVATQTSLNYAAVTFGIPLVDEEYQILKDFYTATNGANWTQKWNTALNNLNESSWYGVAIKNGHVVSIALPSNNLSGSLPESLGGLSSLETLDLQANAISGAIPAGIANLSSLKTLYLQANQLSGTIPLLSGITPLAKLSLSGNLFSGTIPAQFNQFQNIETLDLSNNGFDALETPFTYDLNRIYLNLRGQSIQKTEQLDYSAGEISVDLPFICAYDDAARDYNGKNQFALQANGVTVATATSDGKNLVFPDVNITLISAGAQISVLQSSGAARDAIIRYAGIRDNSQTPVAETEYNALVKLFEQTGGEQWTTPWDTSSNNINQVKWTGIASSDGHIVSIDLSNNNLQGMIPTDLDQLSELRTLVLKQNKLAGDIPSGLANLPKLTTVDLSENELTGLNTAFSPAVNLNLSRQNIAMDPLNLTVNSLFFDNSINRYDQTTGTFGVQSYNVNIGSFNKTISVPAEGLKLISLMNQWNIPNNQAMTLRQIGGAARNSTLTYIINYLEGDANMDGAVNVLDIQANINTILSQSQTYFNFGAGDLNNDSNVNLLDIILLITKIQESAIQSSPSQPDDVGAILSIEDGILYLENPYQKTGAFDIRLKGIEKSQIQDLAAQEGYTLSIAEKDGETGIIGFNSGDCLTGKIAIAKVSDDAQIVDALISDENAAAVSYAVKAPTGLHQTPVGNDKATVSNYPNPFSISTTIKYYLPENADRVILKVFAPSGQMIRISENMENSQGYHETLFPQNNLAAGIYFYQIEIYTKEQLSTYKNKMIIK